LTFSLGIDQGREKVGTGAATARTSLALSRVPRWRADLRTTREDGDAKVDLSTVVHEGISNLIGNVAIDETRWARPFIPK
jgi:hypothetical protein